MRLSILRAALVSACCFSLIWLEAATAKADVGSESVYVQVRSTKMRSQPLMWGASVGDLSYGDRLALVDRKPTDGWFKVKNDKGAQGFVHQSAVSSQRVVLRAHGKLEEARADSSEVVLAGKGFNKEVESEYARKQGLNFSAVDKVEKTRVAGAEIAQFVKDGHLKAQKG